MTSSWTDLERPPLSAERIQAALRDTGLWTSVQVRDTTSSTNADVSAAAAAGEAQGLVVLAEQQLSGRGRLDRQWESPPRAGVLLSVLLRPDLPTAAVALLPLLTGLAVVEAVRAVGAVTATLKWPNDVLVNGRKLGGILLERTPEGAVVVGIGINVSTRRDELPIATATSLALEAGETDREPLVKELLRCLARRYAAFVADRGSPASVLPAYREVCETIGQRVVVQLPAGGAATGTAVAVDESGMLVVRDDDGLETAWSAGEVAHVRTEA